MDNQAVIDNDGHWEEVTPDKPDNIISLDVDDFFVGTFVSRKENSGSQYGGFIYTLERENGNLATMFSTTDLDYSMRKLEPGDKVKITRLKDQPMPPPKKAMQKYKVEKWVKGDG